MGPTKASPASIDLIMPSTPRCAVGAQPITREPREQSNVLGDLGDEPPRDTLPATGTRRGLGPGYRRGSDVETLRATVFVVRTLAPSW